MADDKVFLKEKRSIQRFYFSYTTVDAKVKTVHPDSGNDLLDDVRLNDITTGGMAFKVSNTRAKAILVGSKITLEVIHGIILPQPISGIVAHRSDCFQDEQKEATSGNVKLIGVKFDQPSKLIGAVISQMKAQEENN